MSGTLPWYVARASGLVAWALLAASVVWGLLMTSKVIRRWARSSWLLDLHRWLAGLALVFTAVHVVAILADTYVHFGLTSVLVPLAATWHPVAVADGIVSLYLLIAIEVTSLLRRRINRSVWRAVHFLSFPLFVASTVHGLSAGTDSRAPMVVITVVLVGVAVAALTAVRVANSGSVATPARRRAQGTATGTGSRPIGAARSSHVGRAGPAGTHPTGYDMPTSYVAPSDGHSPTRYPAPPADFDPNRPPRDGRSQPETTGAYRRRG